MSTFNPQEHLTKIKTKQGLKDYLPVAYRLVWFREHCPVGTIETEMMRLDTENKFAVFKAIVADGNGGLAMGTGSETAADFTDYIEKAETKAVGRALAMLGYGTQFTGDELDEMPRIVDSPVDTHVSAPQPTQITNSFNAPTAFELQRLFKGINQSLETAQKLTFRGQPIKPLDNLTPEECVDLKKTYDAWKKTFDKRQEAS